MPTCSAASGAPAKDFRLDRSILRLCPNAASVSRSMTEGSTPSGSAAGTMCTTAEVTFGGGTKAERLTVMARRGFDLHWAATDRRPYASLPGEATIRSATSFWNISVSELHQGGHLPPSHFSSSAVPTL